jgi:flagellar hook assembly protein FlgD
MDAIGRFLGLTEDLSPTISYSLFETSHVEIVIYSVQANVIATIFSGRQVPGNYSYTWNGRNDRGMKMGSGDYVGEVRIGEKRYVRKRIYIP